MQQTILQLLSLLSSLTDKLTQLVNVLQQEQTALVHKEFDAVVTLAGSKQTLSAEIEQLETQRLALCQQLQIHSDFTSINAFLGGLSSKLATRFEQQWDTIIRLGKECSDQNQVNGILVAHQQRHTQQALALLRGISGQNEVYSARGAQQIQDRQLSLGRV